MTDLTRTLADHGAVTSRKYEFTGETRQFLGRTLRRIRARSSFGDVAEGAVGGWIEGEQNLGQSGAAWVSGDARVSCAAHLCHIGPIGSCHAFLTVVRDATLGLRFTTGGFSGSRAEFSSAVSAKHEEGSIPRIEYDAAIALIDAWSRAHSHEMSMEAS